MEEIERKGEYVKVSVLENLQPMETLGKIAIAATMEKIDSGRGKIMEEISRKDVHINVTDTCMHPVAMAMHGSYGEVYNSLYVRADWLLTDLLRATTKTAIICFIVIAKRKLSLMGEKLWKR